MALLSVGKPHKKDERLYLMRIELPTGVKLLKIGKSSGASSKARMMQICESIYDTYRTTPKIKLLRDRKVEDVFTKETCLHHFFVNYQFQGSAKFDGVTECFTLCEDTAIQAYEAVLEGLVPDFVYTTADDTLPF
mgnify:FL=1